MAKRYTLQDWPGPKEAMPNKWATFIPNRQKQFKEHENRGHALNAIQPVWQGILYKLDETTFQWKEVLRIDLLGRPEYCDNCGMKDGEEDGGGNARYVGRKWFGLDQDVPTLAFLCYECQRAAKDLKVK